MTLTLIQLQDNGWGGYCFHLKFHNVSIVEPADTGNLINGFTNKLDLTRTIVHHGPFFHRFVPAWTGGCTVLIHDTYLLSVILPLDHDTGLLLHRLVLWSSDMAPSYYHCVGLAVLDVH